MIRFIRNIFSKKGELVAERNLDNPEQKISQEPDYPLSFGYKICWLVLKSDSPEEVIQKIGGKNVCVVNWESGFDCIYKWNRLDKVFVTPSLNGYVLVLNVEDLFEYEDKLEKLVGEFEEVQYFCSHRGVGVYGWAKYSYGKMVRRYHFCPEDDGYWDDGELTEAEKELGITDLVNGDTEDWDMCTLADEEMVMEIARLWGVDPDLEQYEWEKSVGWLMEMEY